MKRRDFLKRSSVLGLPLMINGMGLQAMRSSSLFNTLNTEDDRVLVLINLNGGNDGLNTLIPLDQYDNLANLRSNIIIPQSNILTLTDTLGFHPALSGFKSLFDNANMHVVQSVGYPNQNRSHFRSTDIWTSASPAEEIWDTGWLGRYSDTVHPTYPNNYPNADFPAPIAITLGPSSSETCEGVAGNFSLAMIDPYVLNPLESGGDDIAPNNIYGDELSYLRNIKEQTNVYSQVIHAAAENGTNVAEYPLSNPLAEQLRNIALLISGGLQTKIYVANLGGFDTHANQVEEGNITGGMHNFLLDLTSSAISAFQEDLKLLGIEDRVLGMTFSEFGRQIISNAAFGTDHGTAAPVFLFGSCVKAGITGENPEIPKQVDPQAGIPMQYDFRDLYGSVLMDWFGVNQNTIEQIFYPDFQYFPIADSCNSYSKNKEVDLSGFDISAYPNPFRNNIRIGFTCRNERVRISIYDTLGYKHLQIVDKTFHAGNHQFNFDGSSLPAGTYYLRIQLAGARQKTTRVIKS
ncbi:MAG: DUF1501 domain-containing protein [Bacteroidetes bacterium]|nr:DUF1501 domain-containing protein [Bacteroidota bacterium]